MSKTRGIITGSLVITLFVGVLNSIYKTDKMPNFRFFFGTGILFLFLSGLAEFEDEIAKALALAIVTFTLLGEGGGVLDHFMGSGTAQTTLDTEPNTKPSNSPVEHPQSQAIIQRRQTRPGTAVAASAGLSPVKPALPH